jgi:hypothetical protein
MRPPLQFFGDAEVFGQHLDPHPLDAGTRDFLESGLDPGFRRDFGHSFSPRS